MPDSVDNSHKTVSIDSALDSLLNPFPDSFYRRFKTRRFSMRFFAFFVLFLFCGFFAFFTIFWRAPAPFSSAVLFSVEKGTTVGTVADRLQERGAVRSAFWFKVWMTLLGGSAGLKAGDYYLSEPVSVISLANRFVKGQEGLQAVRVTIPEGLSNREVADLLSKALIRFDRARFLELAKKKEGYLFPDTYQFAPTIDEARIIAEMEENFQKKIASLDDNISAFERSLHEVITMASLVEGEARTFETRQHIAGILWKRLAKGMPLQVDAVFPYIIGKNTYEVTTTDLKYDSPYNTYLNVGLPPGPINNPSLDAITATLTPILTSYFYYLTDNDGVMRYATTHTEHLKNRAKYLGK